MKNGYDTEKDRTNRGVNNFEKTRDFLDFLGFSGSIEIYRNFSGFLGFFSVPER